MSVRIVVAKYNENVDWCANVKHNVTIYDKSDNPAESSIKLKNIGREGETFLYHIVNNYHNLDDITVFLQGNPFEHLQILVGWRAQLTDNEKQMVINKINNEVNNYSKFSSFYQVLYNSNNGVNDSDARKLLFDTMNIDNKYNMFTSSPGAQYVVPKTTILATPLSTWKKIHNILKLNISADGYSMEQLWFYLFTQSVANIGNHDIEKQRLDGENKFGFHHTLNSWQSIEHLPMLRL
jgi:hypothetical protein